MIECLLGVNNFMEAKSPFDTEADKKRALYLKEARTENEKWWTDIVQATGRIELSSTKYNISFPAQRLLSQVYLQLSKIELRYAIQTAETANSKVKLRDANMEYIMKILERDMSSTNIVHEVHCMVLVIYMLW